jgi:hypothetical protein
MDVVVKKRRHGPDTLTRSIHYFSVISWILIGALVVLFSIAKPETSFNFMGQTVNMNQGWDPGIVQDIFYLMLFLLSISILGLIANAARHRRKEDRYNKSLLFFIFLSIFGIIVYFFNR